MILISIDTLRADRLGCYGYPKPTSPNIDAFAERAIVFENAFAHAPSTLPSHASILTSLLPQQHRASHRFERALAPEAVTLPEVLRDAGYVTASFNGGGQVAADFGLDQGFDVYESVERRVDRFALIVERALDWLDGGANRPVFLFLHTFEVHQPIAVGAGAVVPFLDAEDGVRDDPQVLLRSIRRGDHPLDAAALQFLAAHYDAEIASMDAAFGALVEGLHARGRFDDTVIVFTSDHGEELGERGQVLTHAHTLHHELLRVPLIIKPVGSGEARRVVAVARGIDVLPSVVSLIGLDGAGAFGGRSLIDAAPDDDVPVVAYRDTATNEPVATITFGRYKLMGGRLFDILADPWERQDVADRNPAIVARMRLLLEREVGRDGLLDETPAEIDPETAERLRALGYGG